MTSGATLPESVRVAVHALRTSRSPATPAASVESAWALLGWCESCATLLLSRPDPELLADAIYALFLAEPRLDQREVLNIARVLRFAADRHGLEYLDGIRASGSGGTALAAALQRVPASLPPTHRLVAGPSRDIIERAGPEIDVDELLRQFGP